MMDLRPDIGPALALFGLAATVILPAGETDWGPGGERIVTTGIWLPPVFVERAGVLGQTERPLPILALPRTGIPSVAPGQPVLPRGTIIEIAETPDGTVQSWVVELILGVNADEIRLVVIPTEAAE